jgi:hypothetical protein
MHMNIKGFISLGWVAAVVWGVGSAQAALAKDTHSALFDDISLRYEKVIEGKDFPYYTQAMRIQAITDLARSIQTDYSLLLYKQHTLNVDLDRLGDEALSTEKSLPDVYDEAAQAQGNMEFLDRARKFVANFKDSHFQLDGAQPTASVALGIGIAQIGGKYVVTSLRTPLLKDQLTQKDYKDQVALGDELVTIDGRAPEDQKQAFEPFLPASSDAFREMLATSSITARDFQLPQKSSADVVLLHRGATVSLTLPWYSLSTRRTDQATLFKARGITMISADTVGEIEGLKTPVNISTLFVNSQWRTAIKGLKAEKDFVDASDPSSTVVKFGLLKGAKGPVGFLQIQSFDVDLLQDKASSQGLVKFPELISVIAKMLKTQKISLILDLRNNPGGNPEYAADVLSALAPEKASYSPLSTMYRITELAWETEDAGTSKGLTDPIKLKAQEAVDDAFKNAIAENKPYTEVLPDDPITADPIVGGYDQKIVALTSPNCISACDVMSILLKSSGRATLLGLPTNGTGAGFSSSFEVPTFTDTNHILTARLPNMLFGRPLRSGESAQIDIESIEAENRPTQPDAVYEQDITDVTSGNSDLIQAALKLF